MAKPKSIEKPEKYFTSRALEYMPRWAWATCAILLALSLSIRQMGLDVTTPINRIMTAYAIQIENRSLQPESIDNDRLSEVMRRIKALEANSHPPGVK
jgi:hypothetical protein